MAGFDDLALPLREALARVLMPFMCGDDGDPLQESVMRLFHDEIHDPSPVFAQAFRDVVAPLHQSLSACWRGIGLPGPTTTTHQLAYALQAAAHDFSLPWRDGADVARLARCAGQLRRRARAPRRGGARCWWPRAPWHQSARCRFPRKDHDLPQTMRP